MMNENNIVVNETNAKTWSWCRMNKVLIDKAQIGLDETISNRKLNIGNTNCCEIKSVSMEEAKVISDSLSSDISNGKHKIVSASGKAFEDIVLSSKGEVSLITVNKSFKEPVAVSIDYGNNEKSVSSVIIDARPGVEASFIFIFNSDEKSSGISFFDTKIFAHDNSKVSVAKVQLLGNNFVQFDSTSYIAGDNAEVGYTLIQLGGNSVYSGMHATLSGYKSNLMGKTAYLCTEKQNFDFNHVCLQYGKKTDSKMFVYGTLKDEAKKTYRGTIDFKNGCTGSTGNEQEEVLLLSPKVVNNSIPVILCDEEDVQGEHGATIGRLADDILFYMETRGITKDEAERMMAHAKIQNVLNSINCVEVSDTVLNSRFINTNTEVSL